jgi:DNA-binding response OmpR family regulator
MAIPTLPILLINHNARNLQLLSEYLVKEGYQALTASSYEEFDRLLKSRTPMAAALVDIAGFDAQIWKR